MPDKDAREIAEAMAPALKPGEEIAEVAVNPLAGLPQNYLEAKTGPEFAVQWGYVQGEDEIKKTHVPFFEDMWDTALAIGKAEGMASVSSDVQKRIAELERGRDSWKEAAENIQNAHDGVVADLNAVKLERDHALNRLALMEKSGDASQEELGETQKQLTAAQNRVAELESFASNSLSHILDARRRLAKALGFPEEWVFIPS